MIDYDRLKARVFTPVVQEYSRRDSMIYGLGLNLGADPLDAHSLQYVAADPPQAEPMMAMTLARLGPAELRDRDIVLKKVRASISGSGLGLPGTRKIRRQGVMTSLTLHGRLRGRGGEGSLDRTA